MSTAQTNQLACLAPDYPISGTVTPADPLRPRGKKAPQKSHMDLHIERDRKATDNLFELLNHHHNFNIPPPPPGFKPKKKPVKRVAPPKRVWVSVPADAAPMGPNLKKIREAVCFHFDLDHTELIADRREQKIVYPRHIAFYLAKTLTPLSLPQIGRQYGGKDHTTVLHGVRKMTKRVREEWQVAWDVAMVEGYL